MDSTRRNVQKDMNCIRFSPLDCFAEGGYDYSTSSSTLSLVQDLLPDMDWVDYSRRPAFRNISQEQIMNASTAGCYHEYKALTFGEDLLFGHKPAAHFFRAQLTLLVLCCHS